ncbi:MAG: LPS-assembly protein LptD [Cellvibrionaceae bacterium]
MTYPGTRLSTILFGSLAVYTALGVTSPISAQAAQAVPVDYWRCMTSEHQQWQCANTAPPKSITPKKADKSSKTKSTVIGPHPLDWVSKESLTPEEQALAGNCCGAYREPERTDESANTPPEQAATEIESDSAQWQGKETLNLSGKVAITKGTLQLQADTASMSKEGDAAELSGNITLRQPGVLIRGEKAKVNQAEGSAQIEGAQFVLHQNHIRGQAQSLRKDENNRVILESGEITSCEPGSNDWALKGSEIKLDHDSRQGTIKHMRLSVYDVPVFYAPYLRFPLGDDRMSGFLFPTVSNSDDNGFEIAVPYYINIAANMDATLTPHYMEKRGTALGGEFRHLSAYTETIFQGAYLHKDEKEERTVNGLQEANPFYEEDRWLASIEQKGQFGEHGYSRIDASKVSDEEYFRDISSDSLSSNSRTHLKQEAVLGYRSQHWHSSLKAERYQVIRDDVNSPYQQVPRLDVNGFYTWAMSANSNNELTLNLNHQVVQFDHSDDTQVTGTRARTDYTLHWENIGPSGFITPAVKLSHLSYQLDENLSTVMLDDDNPSITVPGFSLDTGLFFERNGSLFGNGYLQTLEPRLFYQYTDFEDQSALPIFDTALPTFRYGRLFASDRFNGGDRIGDAQQLSAGITNRFIDPTNGREFFSLAAGQIFYDDAPRVSLFDTIESETDYSRSNYILELNARIGEWWTLSSSSEWQAEGEDQNNAEKAYASLRYQDNAYNLFSIGYRYIRRPEQLIDDSLQDRDIEQAEASFILPVAGDLSVIGRYQHDLTSQRELETLAGIEYDNCCWRIQATYRQGVDERLTDLFADDLETEYSIMLSIEFKGLAGVGSGENSVLRENIPGYFERETYLQKRRTQPAQD